MTDPIEIVESGPGRAEGSAGSRRPSRPSPPPTGDGATFAALVDRAAGNRPGALVDDLPTGRAAESWARWRPAEGALGSRSPAGPSASPSARTTLGGDGLATGLTTSTPGLTDVSGLAGLTTDSAGMLAPGGTGAVFPRARSIGEAVVNAGAEHLGVPYRWGGTDPEHGFDCSGLVQDAYRRIGIELPKWSRHQATMGVEVPSIEAARPGDVLTFGHPVNHVALYVGDGRMLHAPRTGEVVKIEEIDRPINSIRRIVDGPGSSSLAPSGVAGPAGLGPDTP